MMTTDVLFYLAGLTAILATLGVITGENVVHSLLYLIVSLLSSALIFFLLGAPFAAALEIVLYAGAIMVLFVFVIMMLNQGPASIAQEKSWLKPRIWIGPGLLATALLAEFLYLGISGPHALLAGSSADIGPKEVGASLFGTYAVGVELASILLLAGLVGAYHLGNHGSERKEA